MLHPVINRFLYYICLEDKKKILSRYTLDSDTKEICEFLKKYPYLFSILEEIPDKVDHYFQNSKDLMLKFLVDPECGEESLCVLVVFFSSKTEVVDACNMLDKFDTGWWLDVSNKGRDKININIVFSPSDK